jgi:hypothetical protein
VNRRKWLWAAVLALPAAVAGGLVYGKGQARTTYTCPLTGEELPCPNCCPLNKQPYVCPVTGEELPCPNCCPLNQKK